MGVAVSTTRPPSTPAAKRLTIDNVYIDAEPDAFDDQVTADGNKILREPPQSRRQDRWLRLCQLVTSQRIWRTPIQPLFTDDEKFGRDIHHGE
jgi:hypothetical protein